ncbi:MAG: hypothetical protein MJ211_01410 [Bacteroidales bacterium]|nr:hypothetical protein [Bacteroidales bacterium]
MENIIKIASNSFDEMFKLAKSLQNNELTEGQEVEIEGTASVCCSQLSIGQGNDNGEWFGTSLVVNGWSSDDLPEDGTPIKVSAFVKKNTEYFFEYLETTPDKVTIL